MGPGLRLGSCPTHSVLRFLTWQSVSSAGLSELALSPVQLDAPSTASFIRGPVLIHAFQDRLTNPVIFPGPGFESSGPVGKVLPQETSPWMTPDLTHLRVPASAGSGSVCHPHCSMHTLVIVVAWSVQSPAPCPMQMDRCCNPAQSSLPQTWLLHTPRTQESHQAQARAWSPCMQVCTAD